MAKFTKKKRLPEYQSKSLIDTTTIGESVMSSKASTPFDPTCQQLLDTVIIGRIKSIYNDNGTLHIVVANTDKHQLCLVYGKQAETAKKHLKTGDLVCITGKIKNEDEERPIHAERVIWLNRREF